jgi:hypothetical protein
MKAMVNGSVATNDVDFARVDDDSGGVGGGFPSIS